MTTTVRRPARPSAATTAAHQADADRREFVRASTERLMTRYSALIERLAAA